MAMYSLSPATSSVRSIYQRPRISAKLTTLVPHQENLSSRSSSVSYVKLKAKNDIVGKKLPQKGFK
ncbi:hypothetical protein R6Q57_010592 [Mikania cordata]